jgi:hypothetical protein
MPKGMVSELNEFWEEGLGEGWRWGNVFKKLTHKMRGRREGVSCCRGVTAIGEVGFLSIQAGAAWGNTR